ncbi:LysR substrate-binding domain-containing protein, partial [Rhizobium leguminosarum]|uniref:LysR substrate-binding domain-containing protein n=1 Tax=Rhizobium leguminosarum TaxID=384 RepID=UPI003F984000
GVDADAARCLFACRGLAFSLGDIGNHVLAPLVPAFMALHPAVTLDISHTDRIVELMEESADVAIRAGPLKNSSLIARKLGA